MAMPLSSGSDLDSGLLTGAAASSISRPHTSMSGSEQSEDIHSLGEIGLIDFLKV